MIPSAAITAAVRRLELARFPQIFPSPFSTQIPVRRQATSVVFDRQNGRGAPRQRVPGQRISADPRALQSSYRFVQRVRRKGLETHRRTEPRRMQRCRPELLFTFQERLRRPSTGNVRRLANNQ